MYIEYPRSNLYVISCIFQVKYDTNGLINESRACKKEAWFLHLCTCIYAPIFIRGPLEIHVKHQESCGSSINYWAITAI